MTAVPSEATADVDGVDVLGAESKHASKGCQQKHQSSKIIEIQFFEFSVPRSQRNVVGLEWFTSSSRCRHICQTRKGSSCRRHRICRSSCRYRRQVQSSLWDSRCKSTFLVHIRKPWCRHHTCKLSSRSRQKPS